MNNGERNELLIKIFLAELKKNKDKSTVFGEIKSLGFGGVDYKILDEEIKKNKHIFYSRKKSQIKISYLKT